MKQVLIAEDNPADQELIRLTFEEVAPDYQLAVVKDGEELIEYLEAHNPFDLHFVLLDLNMPRMSGADVLKKLSASEKYRTIPVIVFSSSVRGDDVTQSYAQGANAYVRKPENLTEYSDTIAAITEFWGKVNVLARPIEAAF